MFSFEAKSVELEGDCQNAFFSREWFEFLWNWLQIPEEKVTVCNEAFFEKQKSQRLHVCLVIKLHVCLLLQLPVSMYSYIFHVAFCWGNGEVQRSAPQMRRDGLRTLRAYRFLAARHIELRTGHGGSWCLQVLHKSLFSAVLLPNFYLRKANKHCKNNVL